MNTRRTIAAVCATGILVASAFSPLNASPVRSDIVDRNGLALATTRGAPSLYANPQKVTDPRGTAEALAKLLPDSQEVALLQRLISVKRFVWLARHVSADVADAVTRSHFPGIGIRVEPVRRYPQGSTTAQVVGFTDIDAQSGDAGVERFFDHALNEGLSPLALSIDVRVQASVRDELMYAIAAYHAVGAAAVVLDASTDEVLALVSLPDFDANDRRGVDPSQRPNKITTSVCEMGGIFEIFSTALALNDGAITPASPLRVSAPLRVGTTLLRDDKPATRPLTVEESFVRSSLIGAARIAGRSNPVAERDFLRRLGLLDTVNVELGETAPRPIAPRWPWGTLTSTTIGYGYGLAVTPLQAAAAATAVVRDGMPSHPTIVKRSGNVGAILASNTAPVVTASTSAQMRRLLRLAVTEGTGHLADVPGYSVGGKTGTSFKAIAGTYRHDLRRTWFFAGFPMVRASAPRYTLLVMLDEPQPESSSSGVTAEWNAAPTTGHIIERIAPQLGVPNENTRVALR